ncbi:MAG: hypothetical protein ACK6D1_08180, partial [Planctomycetota bacterium]
SFADAAALPVADAAPAIEARAAAAASESAVRADAIAPVDATADGDGTPPALALATAVAPPSSAPTAAAGTDSSALATAVHELRADVQATLGPWRDGTPPALAASLAPIRTQLDRHTELLAQHAEGLRGLDERLASAASAAATSAAPAAARPAAAPPVNNPPSWHGPVAFACLGAIWSVLLWWKTGSLALAAGVLVASNALCAHIAARSARRC